MSEPQPSGASVVTEVGAATHRGHVRRTNEDAFVASYPVFVVADGMGGHQAGELASAEVVRAFGAFAGRAAVAARDVMDALVGARERVRAIETAAGHDAGTTVSGVVVSTAGDAPYWLVVNLGDSRTYVYTGGRLEQVSVDHSEVQELVEAGRLSAEEALHHPRRHVVTRALGADADLEPDFWLRPVAADDRVLICTDGLTTEVADATIASVLGSTRSPQAAADALVAAALDAGGRDNVTAVVVDATSLGRAVAVAESTSPRDAVEHPDDGDDTVPRQTVREIRES